MTIQPTLAINFQPNCNTFKCCCMGASEEDEQVYICKDGTYKSMARMSDEEVHKANKRFKEMIIRKLDPLPLDNAKFLQMLEDEGVCLEVNRDNPLTKKRFHDTIDTINKLLGKMHV